MRFIFYAAFVLFTIFCVIVATANNDQVVFSLNPLPFNVSIPAFGLVFIGIFIGLLGGWIVSVYSGFKHVRRHRVADKKINELEKQIKTYQSMNIDLSNDANHGKMPVNNFRN